jgi:iron complex transport system ATP-binding protein
MSMQIDHLSFAYPRVDVLNDVTVTAAHSRITAVIGPNAAGKSTLLRCMVGAISPQRGCVRIDGRPAHKLSARNIARRIAYVPQRSNVAAAFTVREVVELGRYALPVNRSKVDDAIARLDLSDIVDRPYPTLSVGQQQRVTLARAVAQLSRDGHLLLDEPTSAMDLLHIRQSVMLLRELAATGVTIVIAMHDLALAASFVDEVWLLAGGRLISAGSACDVLNADRLASVFGVDFEWIATPLGQRLLVPRIAAAASSPTIPSHG